MINCVMCLQQCLFSMYNVNDACSLKNIVVRLQNASEIDLNDQVGNYLSNGYLQLSTVM